MDFSIIDVLFCFLYLLCGLALGRYSALHFGAIYGLIGFAGGIALGMIGWRCIVRLCFRREP